MAREVAVAQAQFPAVSRITRRDVRLPPLWRSARSVGCSRPVRLALLATLSVAVIRTTVLDWRRVNGHSMAPALAPGQLLACNRLAYGFRLPGMSGYLVEWSAPQPGQLVIYSSPTDGECCVKRVALPPEGLRGLGPGEVWVLGDNSEESCDSRDHGPVPLALIHGRAHVISLTFFHTPRRYFSKAAGLILMSPRLFSPS
jgi:signal peptidase I